MLRRIDQSTAIEMSKVEAIELKNGQTIITINGKEFMSSINYDLMLSMANEEKENILKEKQKPVQTTSASQWAG